MQFTEAPMQEAAVTTSPVKVTREESWVVLTLNRPERRNALSLEMMRELRSRLEEVGEDPSIRAVIVAAEGHVFCSGHDLNELSGRELEDYREIFHECTRLMDTIQQLPQPVIAEVHGVATAAGCQLVAACDLAVATEDALFATPGVKIGLFCSTPMVAISRAIGRKHALEMLLTGRMIHARQAADWGLINAAVIPAELKQRTRTLARYIAESSPLVVAIGKKAFYKQIDENQASAYDDAKEAMSTNAMAEDAQEGISAFLQKRHACWTGR
jgi:enoyl-CoA hydratase/carnithine racemase